MSLDVYLKYPNQQGLPSGDHIFIREAGQTKEITREEWDATHLGVEPVVCEISDDCVYSANITHNLTMMADAAGIYEALWHPEQIGVTKASQLVHFLQAGLDILKNDPEKFKQFNPENGWGSYDGLIRFVTEYLAACREHPDADVSTWT